MRISGFTFVRNAITYDFPVVESIRSLMAVCDEVVVAVGKSDDDTLDLVRSLDDGRLRIIETVWDDSLREGGRVLAQQTDIALAACTGRWRVYLQADEVLHESERERLLDAIDRCDGDPAVEALLFDYLHFYGTYFWLGTGRQWYRREIRAFRDSVDVVSWGDAQGFRARESDGTFRKLRARPSGVHVYHYGWVRSPEQQLKKIRDFSRFWHDDEWVRREIGERDLFDYDSTEQLAPFRGTHPAAMAERIERARAWAGMFDPTRLRKRTFVRKLADLVERTTGWRIGEYRNYTEV